MWNHEIRFFLTVQSQFFQICFFRTNITFKGFKIRTTGTYVIVRTFILICTCRIIRRFVSLKSARYDSFADGRFVSAKGQSDIITFWGNCSFSFSIPFSMMILSWSVRCRFLLLVDIVIDLSWKKKTDIIIIIQEKK